jgi:hypothetical protein
MTAAEIARLRSESASKDLEIVNLLRRKNELKEDREMLNIALDSKQQELELVSIFLHPFTETSCLYYRSSANSQ